jgi:hypothetical protein
MSNEIDLPFLSNKRITNSRVVLKKEILSAYLSFFFRNSLIGQTAYSYGRPESDNSIIKLATFS